jgi:hypothetical protein
MMPQTPETPLTEEGLIRIVSRLAIGAGGWYALTQIWGWLWR